MKPIHKCVKLHRSWKEVWLYKAYEMMTLHLIYYLFYWSYLFASRHFHSSGLHTYTYRHTVVYITNIHRWINHIKQSRPWNKSRILRSRSYLALAGHVMMDLHWKESRLFSCMEVRHTHTNASPWSCLLPGNI